MKDLSSEEWAAIFKRMESDVFDLAGTKRYLLETHPKVLHERHVATTNNIVWDRAETLRFPEHGTVIVSKFLSKVLFEKDETFDKRLKKNELRANVSIMLAALALLVSIFK